MLGSDYPDFAHDHYVMDNQANTDMTCDGVILSVCVGVICRLVKVVPKEMYQITGASDDLHVTANLTSLTAHVHSPKNSTFFIIIMKKA